MKTPSSPRSFSHVDTWVFDLDNTLYPHHVNLWQQVDARIGEFISAYLKISAEEARLIQKDYYKRYGTSMRGMMTVHGVRADDYLAYVHKIDHSPLQPNPAMGAAIAKLPGISEPMGDRRTARIVGTLGLLLENGVALPTALKILRDVVTEPDYVAAVDRVHDQVRNGRRFADALAETNLIPPLAVKMLRVGDDVGDLASIVRQASQFYEHKLGIGLDRLMGAIGPATIIVVSAVIGTLIVSIMSALLSITELAQ